MKLKELNAILNALFDLILGPFRVESPWPGMVAASIFSSIILLLVFRTTSSQKAVRRAKDRLIARLLELVLFKDDIIVNMGAFARVLVANLVYLRKLLAPLCVSLIPFALILIQLSTWFAARPLRPGEAALVKVRFREATPVEKRSVRLTGSARVAIEPPAVRIPSQNEIDRRIRAKEKGKGWIDLHVDGQAIRKEVTIGSRLARVSKRRARRGFMNALLNPAEESLPRESAVSSIEITYPARELIIGGRRINWVVAFVVLSVVFASLLKRPLGVEI